MSKSWCLVLAMVGGGAGCLPEEPEPASSSVTSAVNCGYLCGDNGGVIDGVPFFGMYLQGAPLGLGPDEPHLLHFAHDFNQMKLGWYAPLDVDGGRLRTRIAGTWRYGPANLKNGVLLVGIGPAKYYVKIAEVHSGIVGGTDQGEPFWTTVTTRRAETYTLQWASQDEPVNANGEPPFHDVCPLITTLDDGLWQNQIDAVVFEGEKYNLETTKISLTPTNDYTAWFNVACAGSLPAKMYLTMRASASNLPPTYVNTIADDRQAMVRAWAAEYCGNGISFTQTGHKLLIQDHLPTLGGEGWLPQSEPIGFTDDEVKSKAVTVEAVWDANGAVCLDTPRMAVDDPNVPPDDDIEHKILDKCGKRPDPCTGQSWYPGQWTEHGTFRTATKP